MHESRRSLKQHNLTVAINRVRVISKVSIWIKNQIVKILLLPGSPDTLALHARFADAFIDTQSIAVALIVLGAETKKPKNGLSRLKPL